MRAVQPTGPYLLGGHSFGGLVAFEMACRLEAVGERVALLTIVDSAAPGSLPAGPTHAQGIQRLRDERFAGKVAQLAGSAIGRVQLEAELASAGLLRRKLRQYRVFFLLSRRMTRKYRPQSTVTGPLLLVHAAVPDPDMRRLSPPDSAWTSFASGPVTSVEIAGTHTGIMRRPHVTELASAIGAALDATSI